MLKRQVAKSDIPCLRRYAATKWQAGTAVVLVTQETVYSLRAKWHPPCRMSSGSSVDPLQRCAFVHMWVTAISSRPSQYKEHHPAVLVRVYFLRKRGLCFPTSNLGIDFASIAPGIPLL